MTNDIEYLDARQMRVHRAIARLNERGGTPNTSTVATAARLSRDAAGLAVRELEARGYLRDTGTGAGCSFRRYLRMSNRWSWSMPGGEP